MNDDKLSAQLKALSDPTRRHLLALIHQGQHCGCELIHRINLTQPTLSHHLKVLSDAGFIQGVKEKTRINYTVDTNAMDTVFEKLKAMLEKWPEEAC